MWWQAHLVLCIIMLFLVYDRVPLWKIWACYVGVFIASDVILQIYLNSGSDLGMEWYLYCSLFEACIVALMTRFNHPLALLLSWLSLVSILSHCLAAMAWVDYNLFIEFKHANTFVIKVFEATQLIGFVIFSGEQFRHYDVVKKETRTWQALTQP